jgi:hypothetical protein
MSLLVHSGGVSCQDAASLRREMPTETAAEVIETATCSGGARVSGGGADSAARASWTAVRRRLSRATLDSQATEFTEGNRPNGGQRIQAVTRHPPAWIAQDFGSSRPVCGDRIRSYRADVTRHPRSVSAGNDRAFPDKSWTGCHAPAWAPGSIPAPISLVTHPLSAQQALSVHPKTLAQAPEFAALALLEVALEVSTRALLAEHPTLDDVCEAELEPITLRRARRLLAGFYPLKQAIRSYRQAVFAVTRTAQERDIDELPF